MDVVCGDGDELRVSPVGVLPDDVRAVFEAGVDDDLVAGGEPFGALADRLDDAGPVGAEDARLRRGGQALARPDVQMVEGGGPQADQDLARPGDRIVSVLVAKDLRAAVLVDAHRFHGRILTAERCYLPP